MLLGAEHNINKTLILPAPGPVSLAQQHPQHEMHACLQLRRPSWTSAQMTWVLGVSFITMVTAQEERMAAETWNCQHLERCKMSQLALPGL